MLKGYLDVLMQHRYESEDIEYNCKFFIADAGLGILNGRK